MGKLTIIRGELIITGRSKEIIVLASGENVDPTRIESTIASFLLSQMRFCRMIKVLWLKALIVPDFGKLKEYVAQHFNKAVTSIEQVMEDKNIVAKIKADMNVHR